MSSVDPDTARKSSAAASSESARRRHEQRREPRTIVLDESRAEAEGQRAGGARRRNRVFPAARLSRGEHQRHGAQLRHLEGVDLPLLQQQAAAVRGRDRPRADRVPAQPAPARRDAAQRWTCAQRLSRSPRRSSASSRRTARLALRRLIFDEATRSPEVGQHYYKIGAGASLRGARERPRDARTPAATSTSRRLARHFAGLLSWRVTLERQCAVRAAADGARDRSRSLRTLVDDFMKAFLKPK